MKAKRIFTLALMALLLCLPVWAMANGSIRPWLLDVSNDLWGPVPEERLTVQSFYNNGNILSKYYPRNGVLYHSYHGNPSKDAITNKTFIDVIIHPPKGTHKWIELYYEGVSLSDTNLTSRIQSDLAAPSYVRDFSKGFPYYQRAINLFNRQSNETTCTPMQLASEEKGNLRLAAWYDSKDKLIRVDWIWETSDRFSIPKHDLSAVIFPTYKSESDVPTPVTQPSLINPKTPFPMDFRLVAYRYPSYRNNAEFMELLIIDEYGNPEFDFEYPVVIYWPYPEGHGPFTNHHYQVKHYLDNTRTRYEILDAVPTSKGIRIATKTFSPFELSWTENAAVTQLPKTGDNSNVILWSALAFISVISMMTLVRKKKNA